VRLDHKLNSSSALIVLNTIVVDSWNSSGRKQIPDQKKTKRPGGHCWSITWLRKEIRNISFFESGYSIEWVKEALNADWTTSKPLHRHLMHTSAKVNGPLYRNGIFSEKGWRHEVMLEQYIKRSDRIGAMGELATHMWYPRPLNYQKKLAIMPAA
jgi:glutamine synthetase type III